MTRNRMALQKETDRRSVERKQNKLANEMVLTAEGNPNASIWIRWKRHQLKGEGAMK